MRELNGTYEAGRQRCQVSAKFQPQINFIFTKFSSEKDNVQRDINNCLPGNPADKKTPNNK